MKRSHFKTPRTMDEGQWHGWGAAIEKPWQPSHNVGFWDVVLVTLAVALLAASVAIFLALVGVA